MEKVYYNNILNMQNIAGEQNIVSISNLKSDFPEVLSVKKVSW